MVPLGNSLAITGSENDLFQYSLFSEQNWIFDPWEPRVMEESSYSPTEKKLNSYSFQETFNRQNVQLFSANFETPQFLGNFLDFTQQCLIFSVGRILDFFSRKDYTYQKVLNFMEKTQIFCFKN